ncbi:MAG: hypothetical protein JW888_03760 [Pirellulales bacterium]|nr:hypothetical protein [Pirellulales bacterium]
MSSDANQPELTHDPALLDEQLVAYLDGELDEETARLIETRAESDPKLQERLQEFGRAWELLNQLEQAETAGSFTEATLEMVAIEAEAEAQLREAERPRLRRRRRAMIGAGLLLAGVIGALAGAGLRPDPNRPLLEKLPVIENVDQYIQILDENETAGQSIEFLRKLHEAKLFATEDEGNNEEDKDEIR